MPIAETSPATRIQWMVCDRREGRWRATEMAGQMKRPIVVASASRLSRPIDPRCASGGSEGIGCVNQSSGFPHVAQENSQLASVDQRPANRPWQNRVSRGSIARFVRRCHWGTRLSASRVNNRHSTSRGNDMRSIRSNCHESIRVYVWA